eukprot:Anaeramoba_ignava/a347459_12.p1 GENE.a347459_12~~a347459_12.p1  ORF type:complete len:340 (+),score=13.95 a347459_12:570-1589(+)
MGLKKYIFGSLILIIAIFGYAFSLESGDYRIQVLDFAIVLPVALWIVAPALLIFTLALLHMIYYGLKNYFSLKAVNKDSGSMLKLIQKKLLNEKSNIQFQNPQFKELSEIISQLDISAKDRNFSTENKEISKTVEQIFDIMSGKYISNKELKLPNDNPVMIQNLINRVNSDENFALEAVKKEKGFDKKIVKAAFNKVLETKSITTVKKHMEEIEFDKEMLFKLFEKDSEQKPEFSMTNEMIQKLVSKIELTNDDMITIAKIYIKSMSPDQIIKLYEDISSTNEEFTSAYLYVLCEFEVTDKIRDILLNSAQNEFSAYKALIDLKDAGKHSYNIESISYK